MRGKRGSPVTITIYREGFQAPKKFTVERDIIKVKSVKYTDLNDGYGYIRITSFIEHTGDDLKAAIATHEKKAKTKGLIVDLRNNAGGLLDQAIEVCNAFMNDGIIVSTIGRNKKDKDVVYAHKEGGRTDFPIIVLMNEYSASASEIVAGALQDQKRAIIMGTRSFGKGSVQSVVDLGEGAGLKFTVARYYTPSGRSIQAQGIEPDVKLDPVDMDAFNKAVIHKKAMREADIEGHLLNENASTDDKKDAPASPDDPFWKKDKIAEKDAKAKEEEDAKLTPTERLLKHDYQVAQALNYLKVGTLFRVGSVSIPSTDNSDTDNQKPVASGPATDTPKKVKKTTPKDG
jgi:carboxyl-terminal processing protease